MSIGGTYTKQEHKPYNQLLKVLSVSLFATKANSVICVYIYLTYCNVISFA